MEQLNGLLRTKMKSADKLWGRSANTKFD